MEDLEYLDLPPIVTLRDYDNDPVKFLDGTYGIFERDFRRNRPKECFGKPLNLKSHPYYDGKSCSYFHFTHDGDIETERIPDLRRMERIEWVMFIIRHHSHPYLKIWKKLVKGRTRICILHEAERYLLVLEERDTYILPWTAYYIEHEHRIRKYIKEWEAYKNANAA